MHWEVKDKQLNIIPLLHERKSIFPVKFTRLAKTDPFLLNQHFILIHLNDIYDSFVGAPYGTVTLRFRLKMQTVHNTDSNGVNVCERFP